MAARRLLRAGASRRAAGVNEVEMNGGSDLERPLIDSDEDHPLHDAYLDRQSSSQGAHHASSESVDAEEETKDEHEPERDYFPQRQPPRTSLLVRLAREAGGPWANTVATVVINVPQVILTLVMLMVFSHLPRFGDDQLDDDAERHTGVYFHEAEANARRWVGVNAVRLALTTYTVVVRYVYVEARGWDESTPAVRYVTNARNGLELIKIIWFVIGNMWIFPGLRNSGTDDDCPGCTHTPVFWFCVATIGVQYLEIFFFCLLAILLVPVFCFCLPCFVQFLAAVHDPMDGKGADQKAIDKIPLLSYREPVSKCADEEAGEERDGCPICLGDFVSGDQVRLLPCKHQFHRGCVDQWLLVNATCPSCRASILPDEAKNDQRPAADS